MSNHGRREQVFGGMRQNGLTARRQFTRFLIDKQQTILFREKKTGRDGIDANARRIILRHMNSSIFLSDLITAEAGLSPA